MNPLRGVRPCESEDQEQYLNLRLGAEARVPTPPPGSTGRPDPLPTLPNSPALIGPHRSRSTFRMSPMFHNLPDSVSVYEVSPRDGLQNERATVPLRSKVRLIDALVLAGVRRIEITSFVSPKWIPQLADADEVARHARPPDGVSFSALCPNARGL